MKSFFASPGDFKAEERAAFIRSGNALNLFIGKKPACGARACTASGASSFSMFNRSGCGISRTGGKTEELRRIGAGLQQRRWGQIVERNHVGYRADALEKPLTQRVLQLAEDIVVGVINADLVRALVEIAAFQVRLWSSQARSSPPHPASAATIPPSKESGRPTYRQAP